MSYKYIIFYTDDIIIFATIFLLTINTYAKFANAHNIVVYMHAISPGQHALLPTYPRTVAPLYRFVSVMRLDNTHHLRHQPLPVKALLSQSTVRVLRSWRGGHLQHL